jgi:FkbM family methyltransferase
MADFQYRIADIERLAEHVAACAGSPLSPIRRERLHNRLSTLPIFLMGSTSVFAADFLSFVANRLPVRGVVDDYSKEPSIGGVRRVDSETFQREGAGSIAICLSFSHRGFQYFRELASVAGAEFIDYMEAADAIPDFRYNPILDGLARETAAGISKLLSAARELEDCRSVNTLLSILTARLTYDRCWLEAVNMGGHTMYFGVSCLPLGENETLIDCGAYDGDTIDVFARAVGGRFCKVVALEPDPQNFAALQVRYAADTRIMPHPLGAWRNTGTLTFEGNRGAFSRVAAGDGAGTRIPVTSLDDLIDSPVSIIKIDVEGGEADVLEGARRLIAANKPKLLVAAYHKPLDFADIIWQIREIDPTYRFYLRHHGGFFVETVLYAV